MGCASSNEMLRSVAEQGSDLLTSTSPKMVSVNSSSEDSRFRLELLI